MNYIQITFVFFYQETLFQFIDKYKNCIFQLSQTIDSTVIPLQSILHIM